MAADAARKQPMILLKDSSFLPLSSALTTNLIERLYKANTVAFQCSSILFAEEHLER